MHAARKFISATSRLPQSSPRALLSPLPHNPLLRLRVSRRCYSETINDPTRTDLHYHLQHPPTPLSNSAPAFALTFLPSAPPSATSSTVVGWLPATSEVEAEAGLNDFKENPGFRTLLHEVISEALKQGVDDVQTNAALQMGSGWMHIHDERNVPALGRIGDPDDIIASVLVDEGKIQPETYQAMPAYRLCTADGPTQLTPGLARRLVEALETRASQEKTS
ncbi:unnamed protein product [Mycena citricolor]|uniref:Uncharacterized protein n=1 Tax=Mycena citricolor TaxID=2018698 RepID=A0AAD2JVD3_9AGAR|nr:unnamed protein product [Mycena citricolor]